jgi:hypothetical protein
MGLIAWLPRWRGPSKLSWRVYLLAVPFGTIAGLVAILLPRRSSLRDARTGLAVFLTGLPVGLFFSYVLRGCGTRRGQIAMALFFLLAIPFSVVLGMMFSWGGDAATGEATFAMVVVITFALATFLGGSIVAGDRDVM